MTKNYLNILAIALMLMISLPTLGQRNGDWCDTHDHDEKMMNANPALKLQKMENLQKMEDYLANKVPTANKTSAAPRIVPVVVHVMHQYGSENISLAQINSAIDVLNRDFQKLNSDTSAVRPLFQPLIADANFEFRLAKIDPQGNCTDGVTRTFTTKTENADNDTKQLISWPSNKYFNVWVVKSISGGTSGNIVLGRAQFPSSGINSTYGILMRANYMGTTGTAVDDGRTITHEVGHCFELYHTFQGACGTDCATTGDRVCDTPPTSTNTNACGKNNNQNTCSNDMAGGSSSNPNPYNSNVIDQVENYMSYANCQHMFSLGQKNRMDAAFATYAGLQNLISASNHMATGVNDGYVATLCKPIPEFYTNNNVACAGGSIQFTNSTYNVHIDSANYIWEFQGGTPGTSSSKNPSVTYNTPGKYYAKLIATTTGGSDSIIRNDLITVYPDTASNQAPYFEGAEDSGFPENLPFADQWRVEKPVNSSREWQRSTNSAASGNASAFINGLVMPSGEVHSLISPPIDFTNATSGTVKFKRAYVQRSGITDFLRIYISTNCGQTWQLRYIRSGASLQSVPAGTNGNTIFQPTPSQYVQDEANISPLLNSTAGMIKFEFTAGTPNGGQDLYIDDINIGGLVTSLDKIDEVSQSLSVFPNPFSESFHVNYNLTSTSEVSIDIVDMIGKVYPVQGIEHQSIGSHSVMIDPRQHKFSNGVYFLRLRIDGMTITRKLVKVN